VVITGTSPQENQKERVRAFWDEASSGEVYADGREMRERLDRQAQARYRLEPFIFEFARFDHGAGRDVLEIGIGMGADHLEWAKERPRSLVGIDLTERAVDFTRQRLALHGFRADVKVADAEQLPFNSDSFDIVYSWGVLHHSPDTPKAVSEVQRVLRPGGRALIMIYHRHSIIGLMLWLRYGLLRGSPFTSLQSIYSRYLESPGTKAYTNREARRLFNGFSRVTISTQLSAGDTLDGASGQRHSGATLELARRIWPRPLIKRFLRGFGLFLLVDAVK
jgi:ubiquinone/menaquinone biosynthesis C-methylase UbiE